MPFNKKKMPPPVPPAPTTDPTDFLVDSSLAEFLLMHTAEIKYMAMFGYAFYHGASSLPSCVLQCGSVCVFVFLCEQCETKKERIRVTSHLSCMLSFCRIALVWDFSTTSERQLQIRYDDPQMHRRGYSRSVVS
jgi:hypothetical protein